MELTPKFYELNRAREKHRLVIVPGPVGSAKTYTALFCFMVWATTKFEGAKFGLACISDSQYRNILLDNIKEQWEMFGLKPDTHREGFYFPSLKRPGARPNKFVRLLGGHQGSLNRQRGLTLQGLFIDEFVDFVSKEQIDYLIGRCRLKGAKIFMTCNPMDREHWSKVYYVDRAVQRNATIVPFVMADNPKVDVDTVRDLLAAYDVGSPEWFRYILGQWTGLSSLIYAGCSSSYLKAPPKGEPWRYDVTVDVSHSAVTHALLIAHYPEVEEPVVLTEWRYDGDMYGLAPSVTQVPKMAQSFEDQVEALALPPFADHWATVMVDPAALDWKITLDDFLYENNLENQVAQLRINKSDWTQSTNLTSYWLNSGRIKIAPAAQYLKRELSGYKRKSIRHLERSKSVTGPSSALGPHDGIDALRYFVFNYDLAQRGLGTKPKVRERSIDEHGIHRSYQEAGSSVLRDGFPSTI